MLIMTESKKICIKKYNFIKNRTLIIYAYIIFNKFHTLLSVIISQAKYIKCKIL